VRGELLQRLWHAGLLLTSKWGLCNYYLNVVVQCKLDFIPYPFDVRTQFIWYIRKKKVKIAQLLISICRTRR
jgi:hypothetical protein